MIRRNLIKLAPRLLLSNKRLYINNIGHQLKIVQNQQKSCFCSQKNNDNDDNNDKKNKKDQKKEQKNDNKEEEEEEQEKKEEKKDDKDFFTKITDKIDFEKIIQNIKDFRPNQKHFLVLAILGILGYPFVKDFFLDNNISYQEFVNDHLKKDDVTQICIYKVFNKDGIQNQAQIFLKDDSSKTLLLGNIDNFLENIEAIQHELNIKQEDFIPVQFEYTLDKNKLFDRSLNFFSTLVSLGILIALIRQFQKGGGKGGGGMGGGQDIFGIGKSNVKIFGLDSQVKVNFKDVAGLDEAKLEIQEFVDFLKRPKKYRDMGARIPRGALLAGPPGTGKTLLAKATAGEAKVPFLYMSGSDFVEMYVGVGASRVRDLFKQAKQRSPCIIFIDEIDAIGRKRENKVGGNDEKDNTLNQLLVEMDGFGTDQAVIILAATNRAELLDPALTRPGRFDRAIDVTLPDLEGRKQIFRVHLKPIHLCTKITVEEYAQRLSTLTPGFSGADISNLCNEAAILAARHNKEFVEAIDFEMAAERVMAGLEKKKIVSPEERKIVAVHEAGHACVSWFLEGCSPLVKLTIIPRSKGSLGYAQYLPKESSLENKDELFNKLCFMLGGRCAEQHFFNQVTTGAYDDLQKVYSLAYQYVTKFGMSESIGYIGFQDEQYTKTHSQETQREIDQEVKKLIDLATEKSLLTVKKHEKQIQALSEALIEKETLDLKGIIAVLGERPFEHKQHFKDYLDTKNTIEQEQEAAKNESNPESIETNKETSLN